MNLAKSLEDLKREGLTFGDCVIAFGLNRDNDPITKAAHEKYHNDGEIEIDTTTVRSGSDGDGDYVLAWVWVYNSEAGLPDKVQS